MILIFPLQKMICGAMRYLFTAIPILELFNFEFNAVKGALKPDFIFEYNRQNQLIKMVAVEEGMSGDYYNWLYVYGDEGLKIIEKCFSRENILLGYFEYEYK